MSFLDKLHSNMKILSDDLNGLTVSYNENFVIIKQFGDGTAWSFTHENFKNFLTSLNECDIIMGREKALDEFNKSRD